MGKIGMNKRRPISDKTRRESLKIFSPGQISAIEMALEKRIEDLEKRLKNAAEAGDPIEEIKLLLQDAEEALEIVK
ncbi:hypothetical protein [Paenibacillus jiagnxiensis]|uniref:hypothetical protein n=1 Tax=Paenibacillus jiagnxiensis TaxID=3228926 RepID=UPI00339DF950